jgi:hypothetical protein
MASPVHHTDQVAQKSSTAPVSTRVAAPTVALISMPAKAARKTRARTSLSRLSSARKPTRVSSRQAQTGASVSPAVIATTPATDGPIATLARNAPIAMPGQQPMPRRTRQARAIPVGGHSGVTWSRTTASCNPTLATA